VLSTLPANKDVVVVVVVVLIAASSNEIEFKDFGRKELTEPNGRSAERAKSAEE
jgi:hypothetical protein